MNANNRQDELELIAVIDLGTSAVRLMLAQVEKKTGKERSPHAFSLKIIEQLTTPFAEGEIIYRTGSISHTHILHVIEILQRFQEFCQAYPITKILAIGTHAWYNAINRDIFIDRVFTQTGIRIHLISNIEISQLTYLAIRYALRSYLHAFLKSDYLVLEVSGGGCEIMNLHRGKLNFTHTFPIGSLSIKRYLQQQHDLHREEIWEQSHNYLANTLDYFLTLLPKSDYQVIVLGSEVRLAIELMGKTFPSGESYVLLRSTEFIEFTRSLLHSPPNKIASKYNLTLLEVDHLLPNLLLTSLLLDKTEDKAIIVPNVNIRIGLVVQHILNSATINNIFYSQTLANIRSMLRHYHADIHHAEYVRKMALMIFNLLKDSYGLTPLDGQLLEYAALLHDIGSFVNPSSHHKHSAYIIRNTEIFGLNEERRNLVALVARYHRRNHPQLKHPEYAELSVPHRILIQKLASILRVADAMDRSHLQLLKDVQLCLEKDRLIIKSPSSSSNLSSEQEAIKEKGKLMYEVFGIMPVLE